MRRFFPYLYLGLLMLSSSIVYFGFDSVNWDTNIDQVLQGPSMSHIMWTDSLGRDLFLRCLSSSMLTLFVGSFSCFGSFLIGFSVGLFSGWRGGKIDVAVMRAVDILMTLPQIVWISILVIPVSRILQESESLLAAFILILPLSFGTWMFFARWTRNIVIEARSQLFLEAARAIGCTEAQIVTRHLVPHLVPSILVLIAMQIPHFLLFESMLSFFGIGIQPPQATWGVLIQEGWKTLAIYPHLILGPSLFLVSTILVINLSFEVARQESSLRKLFQGLQRRTD